MNKHEMTSEDVEYFASQMQENDIDFWIDGGWGIDALIGRQTRAHGDLDIVVQEKDVPAIKKILETQGFKVLNRDDLADNYFHMADDKGHEIDVTAIVFDEYGNGIWGPIENNEMNPADSFNGRGKIGEQKVKCVSIEYAIKFRSDHELWTHDAEDVRALCNEFGLPIPTRYAET